MMMTLVPGQIIKQGKSGYHQKVTIHSGKILTGGQVGNGEDFRGDCHKSAEQADGKAVQKHPMKPTGSHNLIVFISIVERDKHRTVGQ